MTTLERQVVNYLYESLLDRSVDEAGAENSVAYLKAGGTVDDLHSAIVNSAEFKARSNQPKSDHPLSHIPTVWKEDKLSYFTHRGSYRPLSLVIETVNICNNDCIICPYSAQTRRKQYMPLDLFSQAIRQYSEIGGGPVGLTPMVGEVLLDKMLLDRLRILDDSPAVTVVSAISNGSMAYLYTDQQLAEILSYFDRLTISIYGLDREEFSLMTRNDAYDSFRRGLVRILAIMGPDKVRLGARYLRKRPVSEISSWAGRLARDAGIEPEKVQVHGTSSYANWGFFDTSKPLPFDAEWLPVRTNSVQCALPLISAQILSDGTTSFCGCANFDGKSELNIGNIATTSLREMMASDRVRQLWNWTKFGVPEFCRTCSFHLPIDQLDGLSSAYSDPLGTFGG